MTQVAGRDRHDSEIMLNMLLDLATEIIDTSHWTVMGTGDEFWIVAKATPTEAIINGIRSREIAERVLRDWNTPERQAKRIAAVRRSLGDPFSSWADC